MSGRGETQQHRRAGEFATVRQIRGAHNAAGGLWFERDAMQFFGTQIEPNVYGGRYFVTSERDPHGIAWQGERRWSVRVVLDDATIDTASEFGEYATREAAHAAARAFVTDREAQ